MARAPLPGLIAAVLTLLLAGGCGDSDRSRQAAASTESATSASASVLPADVVALTGSPGEIVGIVRMEGSVPALKAIDASSCADCAKLHPGGIADETIVRAPNGALQNVVVFLTTDASALPDALAGAQALPPVQLDQVGCQYEPHVVALQIGQKLNVSSSDPFVHNVHGQAIDNPAFNFSDRQMMLTFEKPEIFPVRCDVHPWMKAWVAVFPNALFSVSDSGGSFRIRNVPPGRHTLVAWQERLGRLTREIDVPKNEPLKISLAYAK